MSVNKVILVGHLGDDVETRFMTTGDAVANASLATSERWVDKNGEKQEKTEWHRLVFYRKTAEIAGHYLKKGGQIYVEGKLQTRKWQDKETGQDRYTTEIIVHQMQMLGKRSSEESAPAPAPASAPTQEPASAPTQGPEKDKDAFDNFSDDIPF